MGSESVLISSSSTHSRRRKMHCYYVLESPLVTAWTSQNLGWRFYGRGLYKVHLKSNFQFVYLAYKFTNLWLIGYFHHTVCIIQLQGKKEYSFFDWYDKQIPDRSHEVINSLLNNVNDLKKKNGLTQKIKDDL